MFWSNLKNSILFNFMQGCEILHDLLELEVCSDNDSHLLLHRSLAQNTYSYFHDGKYWFIMVTILNGSDSKSKTGVDIHLENTF